MDNDDQSGVPPGIEALVIVFMFFAVCSAIGHWLDQHQKEITWALVMSLKFTMFVLATSFGSYFIYRMLEAHKEWLRYSYYRVTKLEEALGDLNYQLSDQTVDLSRKWQRIREAEKAISELKKFTRFDEEQERKKKLKEAMEAVGAKDDPETSKESEIAEDFGGMTEEEFETNGSRSDVSESY